MQLRLSCVQRPRIVDDGDNCQRNGKVNDELVNRNVEQEHKAPEVKEFSREAALDISPGRQPWGFPRKSWSRPATMTRFPVSASLLHTFTSSISKNWPSSIPITRVRSSSNSSISLACATNCDLIFISLWLTI